MIFIEYAINHQWQDSTPSEVFDTYNRRAVERLFRLSLDWPEHPAVVIFNFYSFFRGEEFAPAYPEGSGPFWSNAENWFQEFSLYYHLPTLSLKAAVYELFLKNVTHFLVCGCNWFRLDSHRSFTEG